MRTQLRITTLTFFVLCSFFLLTCTKENNNNQNPPPNNSDTTQGLGAIVTPKSVYDSLPQAPVLTGGSSINDPSHFLQIPTNAFFQGSEGSCASCAAAMAKSILDHETLNSDYPSDKIIYSPAYLFNQFHKNQNNCGTGTMTWQPLEIIKQQGDCYESDMRYQDGYCSVQPTTQQITLAASHISDWGTVPVTLDEIKNRLSLDQPVILTITADAFFHSQWGTDATWNAIAYPLDVTWHAIVIYGWDDGKPAFKILNSWGNNWGNKGTLWIDYDFIKNSSVFHEAYALYNTAVIGNVLQISGDLNFGDVQVNSTSTKSLTLQNTGSSVINISNISINSPYSVDWANGTIDAGATRILHVNFTPIIQGTSNQTLTITSDASNETAALQASGNGIQQQTQTKIISLSGNLSFGNVDVGKTLSKTLTISNTGNTPLNVTSISYNNSVFSGNWSGSISAGSSQDVTVTFAPSAAQTYSGTLTVNCDKTSGTNTASLDGTGTQTQQQTKIISLSGNLSFGNVDVGKTSSKTLTISNTGNSALNITSINYNNSVFSGSWNGSIPAGSSQDVTITFAPLAAQTYSGTLTVNCDKTSGTNTASLDGTGTQIQQQTKIISLSGNLSFGNVIIGQTQSSTLTISNNGNSPLTVSSITTPFRFSVGGGYASPIAAGSSINITVYFSPTSVQSYSGDIVVNSDATSGTNTINASGNGISSGPTAVPPVGQYSDCVSIDSYNCSPTIFALGIISSRIVSINTTTHQIVFEIKRCDGSPFGDGGSMNVVNLLCGGQGAVSYGFGTFQAGITTFQLTTTDFNMVGSKAYVVFISQTVGFTTYNFSAPTIVVTY